MIETRMETLVTTDYLTRHPGRTLELDIIHRAYRAFLAHDVDALLDTLSPDIEWVHPDGMAEYGLGGTKHGHDGVLEFLAHVPSVLGGMRLDPREFVQSGDRVVVFGTRQVTSRRGRTETMPFVHSWTLSKGRAVRMEDIFDTVLLHSLIES
ncbi:nuclear transport factor 2 family protein [Streptomyces sp. NBC_00237]|uniref:nuclear transport factor 2 family protein n=1 Tax=Streptomyces sp. NBC_00237 TaxID=2975687 RepID=UPI002258D116|nr:nuclear transport factor 2 family protein [Streptomyces sp. NBC_00237]MCX5203723.1 nuclear transport factor 2 family protein [Streptomyces sp. NBC_00237]